jgi:hypothetical protein
LLEKTRRNSFLKIEVIGLRWKIDKILVDKIDFEEYLGIDFEKGFTDKNSGVKRALLQRLVVKRNGIYKRLMIPLRGGLFLVGEIGGRGEGKLRNGGMQNNSKRILERSSLTVIF